MSAVRKLVDGQPKERPILFSAPMILAILADAKTQTRRVVKAAIPAEADEVFAWHEPEMEARGVKLAEQGLYARRTGRDGWLRFLGACPYGKPGARLWVRETWCSAYARAGFGVIYGADGAFRQTGRHAEKGPHFNADDRLSLKWRPSIFMPRWASRITLEVTGVRVERVQDISYDDARAEGVGYGLHSAELLGALAKENPGKPLPPDAREMYRVLWDSINGERPGCSWDANPWVWAVEFERVTP